jgi:hypothetical protein
MISGFEFVVNHASLTWDSALGVSSRTRLGSKNRIKEKIS